MSLSTIHLISFHKYCTIYFYNATLLLNAQFFKGERVSGKLIKQMGMKTFGKPILELLANIQDIDLDGFIYLIPNNYKTIIFFLEIKMVNLAQRYYTISLRVHLRNDSGMFWGRPFFCGSRPL